MQTTEAEPHEVARHKFECPRCGYISVEPARLTTIIPRPWMKDREVGNPITLLVCSDAEIPCGEPFLYVLPEDTMFPEPDNPREVKRWLKGTYVYLTSKKGTDGLPEYQWSPYTQDEYERRIKTLLSSRITTTAKQV